MSNWETDRSFPDDVPDELRVGQAIFVPHGVTRASLFGIDYNAFEGKWICVNVSRTEGCTHFENWTEAMAEGTIKRITEKGFGFIDDGSGKDMFFHSSACDGGFDQLYEGQQVTYNVGSGPKGPCADNVKSV
jgi:CspA family cold shock protein